MKTHTLRTSPFIARTVVVLLVFALVLHIGQRVGQREAQAQNNAMRRAAEVNLLAVRSVVEKYKYLPFTVAQHPEVTRALQHSGDATVITRANQYLQSINLRAQSSALYVLNMQGKTIAASNWDLAESFVGKNYAVRPYFTQALRGESGIFYAVGKDTGFPGLFLAAPVTDATKVIGVVAVKVSLFEMDAAWRDLGGPTMLSDSFGVVFLGSAQPFIDLGYGKQRSYLLKHPLKPAQTQWLQDHYVYGQALGLRNVPWTQDQGQTNIADGEPYFVRAIKPEPLIYLAMDQAVFDDSDPYRSLGWTLTVMSDYAPVIRARNNAWVFASLVAGLMGMLVFLWRARDLRLREVTRASLELERRVLERTRELGEAHAFRKAMEDSLIVGMRARDLDGRIIYVNPAHGQITGYSRQEVLGKLPPYPYWHPDDIERHWHNSGAALLGHAALSGWESRLLHKDGREVHTMVYTAPLIDALGQHTGWMSSVVDITQQKKSQALQRQQLEQLQHAQRLASMGEMASMVGHELSQPLEAIGNFANAASDFAQQNNQSMLHSSLQEIQLQIQRAAEILKRIKFIGKRQTPGQTPTQLNTVAGNVLTWLAPQISHWQTRVQTHFDVALLPVLADTVLLEQVVLNLVLNALQAMSALPTEQRVLEIATVQDGTKVTLRVSDHGPGVAHDLVSRIFEPFFTTKAQGLGLGLNICRTIVESHRGSLTVNNSHRGGAIFSLKLEGILCESN